MGLLSGMSFFLFIFLFSFSAFSLSPVSSFLSLLERDSNSDVRKKADVRLAPHGRKLELFGRKHNTRPGWLTLGNQCTSSFSMSC